MKNEITRMHSSRMRTIRSSSCLPSFSPRGGEVSLLLVPGDLPSVYGVSAFGPGDV